jgi:aspartate-semialdehyde dehydrogenase
MANNFFRIAIVGAATLKGKELKDVIDEMNFPARDVKLLDTEDAQGQLESVGDEVTFIQSAAAADFQGMDFVFFAGDSDFTRKYWEMACDAGATVLDLSYALDRENGAPVRSIWVERERGAATEDFSTTAVTVAHPIATVLALILLRAKRVADFRTAAVTLFEPVSEQGKAGMDELHQQTVHLLSFQPLPKDVFGEQIAFNTVAMYGQGSGTALETTRERVIRHFRQIVAGAVEVPSLMLVQTPTFHGHTFSIYIELERDCNVEDLERAFAGEHLTVHHPGAAADDDEGDELPSNVNVAGQAGAMLFVRAEPSRKNAFWIWGAADNLRIAGMSAIECANSLAALRPSGKVQ